MNETWLTLAGNVGSVVVRDLTNGGQVTTLRVASTPRRFANGEWSDGPTAWHTVKAWRALATHVAAQVHAGDPVVVLGRLVAEEWTRSDGTVASENVVMASALGLDLARGGARQRSGSPEPVEPPPTDFESQPVESQPMGPPPVEDPWGIAVTRPPVDMQASDEGQEAVAAAMPVRTVS